MQAPTMTVEDLRRTLAAIPRVPLACTPTPLQECRRLAAVGGRGGRMFVKRDDLTGLGLGGNKVRHFEYRVAHARQLGCDAVVYYGSANAARIATAACARAGMHTVIAVVDEREARRLANVRLALLMGAQLQQLGRVAESDLDAALRRLEADLTREGLVPYVAQSYRWFHTSAVVAYLAAALELWEQTRPLGLERLAIYVVTGHSHVGLALASAILGFPWRIVGVGVGQGFEGTTAPTMWGLEALHCLGIGGGLPFEVEVERGFAGQYHRGTTASWEAVRLAARLEGLVLDPEYTGKAMAACLAHSGGRAAAVDATVFVHTGGVPILFDHFDTIGGTETRGG